MSQTPETVDLTHFDVRVIPCRQKHALIFKRWAELPVGAHFVLVNDHDPVPLYYQFAAQFPGAFNWEYLLSGPDEFQVRITRLAESPTSAPITPPSCSGSRPVAANEVDARGLEPPEPMMRILAAAENLPAGTTLTALTDRRPLHLYPELDARKIVHNSEQMPDGSWRTTLKRA
jgi:uncharacterized protein (DUF2249 family)